MTKRLHHVLFAFAAMVVLVGCNSTAEVTASDEPASAEPTTAPPRETTQPTTIAPTSVPQPPATQVPDPTALPEPTAPPTPEPTPAPEPTPTPPPPVAQISDVDHSGLAGTRGLTLQWISWEPEDWGRVEFSPLVDGTYLVAGRQDGSGGDYVEIDGIINAVSDRELRFTGTVSVLVAFNNGAEPCIRTGEMVFLATGDRRFWRLQDQLNCDGIVTDYVDIYFG